MAETLRSTFNRGSLSTLADALRLIKFGDVLDSLAATLRRSGTVASAGVDAGALVTAAQQADVPALGVLSAYARSGAGAAGPLAQAAAYPPVAGEVGVAPNGAVVTAAADAWTSVDVVYLPAKGDVVEVTVSVVPGTGVAAIPPSVAAAGMVMLLDAESLAGGFTGAAEVLEPGAGAPAAGQARLNLALTGVTFAAADAVTQARLRVLVCSAQELSAQLAGQSTLI